VKEQSNDAYTIVVFRGHSAPPLRFSFSKAMTRRLAILGASLVLAELLLISHYAIQTGKAWELQALREEVLSVRGQTVAFSNAIDDLKRRMVAMKEVNERLRIMLGIDPDKSQEILNGKGGEDLPIPGVQGPQGGMDGGTPLPQESPPLSPPAGDPSKVDEGLSDYQLRYKVQDGLTWLTNEAARQEQTLVQLEDVAQEKSARWASTPSVWPVKGWVTSGFGPRVSPFTGEFAMHDGLDIGTAPNAPVQAPAAGRVTALGFDPKMGNMIRVEHGYGFETQYAHLAKILVTNGQRVRRGDIIGLVGNTGLSTGPHLHYLVKVNSRPVNPVNYILN